MIRHRSIVLFLLLMVVLSTFALPRSYRSRDLECPLCSFKNECCNGRMYDILYRTYKPGWIGPFGDELSDRGFVYHCRNCRFTCFERELLNIFFADRYYNDDSPDPADIQNAKNIMASFDFSHYEYRYKHKDLPRYFKYEIIRKLYAEGFVNDCWEWHSADIDYIFFAKVNFIIGYEYYVANRYKDATKAFERGLAQLDKFPRAKHSYKYFLYKGSIKYFLGDPIEAIRNYEKGIQLIEKDDSINGGVFKELCYLNSFFINSREVLGPFLEKPFGYLFLIRNIAFVRAFNITFDGYLLGILLFIVLLAGWVYLSKYEKGTNSRAPSYVFIFLTFPLSHELAGLFFYKFRVHQSLRSVLLVVVTWIFLYKIVRTIILRKYPGNDRLEALFSKRFRILYHSVLLLPWIMFGITTGLSPYELVRFFWGEWYHCFQNSENVGFTIVSLLFWFPVVVGIYGIHAFFSRLTPKERDGIIYSILTVFCSLVLFLIPVWFMLESRGDVNRDLFYLIVSVTWYALFIWFEYKAARPLSVRYSFFRRWTYAYNSRHWNFIRILFFFYPAFFHMFPHREHFVRNLAFMLFWPVVAVLLYAMHYGMARLFPESKQKMDYSILITILSLLVMYVAMPFADVSEYYFEDFPVVYIAGGVLWFTLWFQYKKRLGRIGESGKVPVFLEYFNNNRLFWVLERALIWLPVFYTIIWSNSIEYH